MDEHFTVLLSRLKLTSKQTEDAKTKYRRVAKSLHNAYYSNEYDGSTKLLIGSYGKRTNIRPPADIDLLFKIPAETYDRYSNYEGNGQAALLQDIRQKLSESYTTTEKISAWGKVVLVKFSEGSHDVELLPAFEVGGVFMIPNSENGGSWESFDARADMKAIGDSDAVSGGVARPLIKMIKRWRNHTPSMNLKSYEIEMLVVEFLETNSVAGDSWSEIVSSFFGWLNNKSTSFSSYVSSANSRAIKARECELNGKLKESCDEWRKIFGNRFPVYDVNLSKIKELTRNYPSSDEEFIENIFDMRPDPNLILKIIVEVVPPKTGGWQQIIRTLEHFIEKFGGLPKASSLQFRAVTNYEGGGRYYWKVRNFGAEAQTSNDLRGKIKEGAPDGKWSENTKYFGTHYIECYLIQGERCVAFNRRYVPINTEVNDEQ